MEGRAFLGGAQGVSHTYICLFTYSLRKIFLLKLKNDGVCTRNLISTKAGSQVSLEEFKMPQTKRRERALSVSDFG